MFCDVSDCSVRFTGMGVSMCGQLRVRRVIDDIRERSIKRKSECELSKTHWPLHRPRNHPFPILFSQQGPCLMNPRPEIMGAKAVSTRLMPWSNHSAHCISTKGRGRNVSLVRRGAPRCVFLAHRMVWITDTPNAEPINCSSLLFLSRCTRY